MEYHELLRKCINESGLTLDEIVSKLKDFNLDITKSYISQLQNDKVNPASAELNRAIAKITGCDPEDLLISAHMKKAPKEIKEKFEQLLSLKEARNKYEREYRIEEAKTGYLTNDRLVQIPLLGYIAAGVPIDLIESAEDIEYIEKSSLRGRQAFALRVKGESMIGDHIQDGDIVICLSQEEVHPHEIAVVAVDNDTATLKRVKCEGEMCMLVPSNPAMQPTLVKSDRIKILGKVIEVRRNFKL